MADSDGDTTSLYLYIIILKKEASAEMGNINYNAVLADLEAKKAELEAAIATITNLVAGSGNSDGGSGGVISPENIPVGAFLRLSIADATKKFLDMVKTKQTVPQIIKALESGGLPPVKYTTLYTVLRRRESQIGDVLRLGDEWALTEWYPNNPNLKRNSAKAGKSDAIGKKKAPAKVKAKKQKTATPAKTAAPKVAKTAKAPDSAPTSAAQTVPDLVLKILEKAGNSLDTKVIAERLNADFGKKIGAGFLKPLLRRDKKKRFKNVADNVWDLAERPEK